MAKGFIRWTPDKEWPLVAHLAQEHIEKGLTRFDALKRAQKMLPKSRRLSEELLKARCSVGPGLRAFDNALKRAQALGPEKLAEWMPLVPAVETEPEKPTLTAGRVFWTGLELALLARRISYWRERLGDQRPLSTHFIAAQEIELPEFRRKARSSIYSGSNDGKLAGMLRSGVNSLHLLKDTPFIPDATTYEQARAQPAQEPEAPTPALTTEQTIQQPAEALAAVTTAPPPPGSNAHELARWVGISLANAVVPLIETLLNSHEAAVMQRIRAAAEEEHAKLAASMSQMMLEGLDRMLGGQPVPAVAAVAAVAVDEPEERRKRVKFDIVGFETGKDQMLVETGLNGYAQDVDLRFVHPDSTSSYAPHSDRIVILVTGRVSHGLQNKIRACGCQTVYVKRTPGHVLTAIGNVMKEHGATRAH